MTVLIRWGLQGTSQGRRKIGSLLDIQEKLLGTKMKLNVEDEKKNVNTSRRMTFLVG